MMNSRCWDRFSDRPYDPYLTASTPVWGGSEPDTDEESDRPDRFHTGITWLTPIDRAIVWDRVVNGLRSGIIWKKYKPHLTQSGAWDAMLAPTIRLCFIIAHPEYTNETREDVITRCRYPVEVTAWIGMGSTVGAARYLSMSQSTIYGRLVRDIKREPMLRVMRDLHSVKTEHTPQKILAEKAARRLV